MTKIARMIQPRRVVFCDILCRLCDLYGSFLRPLVYTSQNARSKFPSAVLRAVNYKVDLEGDVSRQRRPHVLSNSAKI